MKTAAAGLVAISILAVVACDRPARARDARNGDTASVQPALTVDSILPPGEALRRFQTVLPRVSDLEPAVRSRDELVAKFVGAIESADTLALMGLHVSKPEYGFLYFPTSVYSRKPYELPPDVAWLLSEQNSQKGRVRLTRRLGGKQLGFEAYNCGEPEVEGENRFWRSCQVGYIDPATKRPITRKLFGAIMEHGGRYKFLSYSNDF